VSTSPGCIELPSHLSAALALRPGAEVLLQALPQLAAAAAVMVEPLGPADWEVVELNAGLLEEHVLGQVRHVDPCGGAHGLGPRPMCRYGFENESHVRGVHARCMVCMQGTSESKAMCRQEGTPTMWGLLNPSMLT
jgi:hypothetical protein